MKDPITSKSQIRRMEAQGGDAAHQLLEQVWKLEAENKQLNEFIGQAFCADALPDWREYSALIKELVELRAENKELISRLKSREQFVLDHEECDKKMEKMRAEVESWKSQAIEAMGPMATRIEITRERDELEAENARLRAVVELAQWMERNCNHGALSIMMGDSFVLELVKRLAALSTPSPDSTEGV